MKKEFGRRSDGVMAYQYTIQNESLTAVLSDHGATLLKLFVPDAAGNVADVVLGYDSVEQYEADRDTYVGALVGRVANRIAKGRFSLDGKEYALAVNNGPNHLHGGVEGFDRKVCRAAVSNDALFFYFVSPDGEEGYPGTLRCCVQYRLDEDNALHIRYRAETDAPTPVNLTNHSYFNLGGEAMAHTLQIFADAITENDETSIPTGAMLPVAGTAFDFTEAKAIGRDIGAQEQQLKFGNGYDHNFILRGEGMREAAVLRSAESGIAMAVETDCPGMQVYTANFFGDREGKGGAPYSNRCAVALETQSFPDALHHENFPSVVLRPGEVYESETVYRFFTEDV